MLLNVCRDQRDVALWFPCAPILALFDQHGRVKRQSGSATIEISTTHDVTCLLVNTDCDSEQDLCFATVLVTDQRRAFEKEVQELSRMTHPPIFKSDWFEARSPLDFWKHFIDGEVFDPRPSRQGGGRFVCQQCAFAWWSYLQRMHRSSGMGILRVLAREVAWSARVRLKERGEWTHGFWCEPPETHMRFVGDGLHLLISEGEVLGESEWIDDAEMAMELVIQRNTDTLDGDLLWFLHDSLELGVPAPSTGAGILGATRGNTLCLNTHVQALTVLQRLLNRADGQRSKSLEDAYRRGLDALKKILELCPAEPLYAMIGNWVVPAVTAKGQSGLFARLQRILFFRVLRRFYWRARRAYPRLVYTNGFIERDMTSAMLADDYHVLNIKDLLMLYARDSQNWMESIVTRGVGFLTRLDLATGLERSPLFMDAVDVYRLAGILVDQRYSEMADRAEVTIQRFSGGALLEDALLWTLDLRQEPGRPDDSSLFPTSAEE